MIVKIVCEVSVRAEEEDLEQQNVVYCLTFPNGKQYVGLTSQKLRERVSAHCSCAFNKSLVRYKSKVCQAIRKYQTFTVSILYQGEQLEENEIKYIELLQTFKHGYNLTSGGEHKKKISIITRRKISKANKGRSVVNKGMPMSQEQKQLLSKICKQTYLNGRVNPNRKAVYQLDLDGNIIAEYESMTDADKATGVSFKKISLCCKGLQKTCGGFKWKLKE